MLVWSNGGEWRIATTAGSPKPLTVELPRIVETVATAAPLRSQAASRNKPITGGETQTTRTAIPSAHPQPLGLPFGDRYYPTHQLHARPIPMRPIEPIYPADKEHQAGRVVMRLFINENGMVDAYQIVESYPSSGFETSAVDAFLAARFFPGKIAGRAVRSQIKVEVRFSPALLPQTTIIDAS